MTVPSSHRPRLRELGIELGRLPTGPLNAISDVAGVRVGVTTLIAGDGPLVPGTGPVRTGVTAIFPHEGNPYVAQVPIVVHVINGAGEVTGRSEIDEWALLETPICLTNTLSVGGVYDAVLTWMFRQAASLGHEAWVIPVVAECFDGHLNDIQGRHVREEHVLAALDGAVGGPVPEGSVGGGTGMTCHGFKGGNGTASRVAETGGGRWTVGALVQANHGARDDLRVGGLNVGRLLTPTPPVRTGEGSIIIVLATDAPLDTHQLRRLSARGALGLARTGSFAGNGSGDFVIAFSNYPGNRVPPEAHGAPRALTTLYNDDMNPLFLAAVECVEEAVLNALCAAGDMDGRDGHFAPGLPSDQLRDLWRAHTPSRNA